MNYWLIADTHFGHIKIVQYCNRPDNFNELLLENLKVIPDEDILIHLGDFAFWRDENINEYQKAFNNFNFKKILVKGNHDKKSDTWYMQNGWDFVCNSFTLKKFGFKLLFSHRPLKLQDNEYTNLFGHLHNNENFKWTKNKILIAVEYTNYKPIQLDKVIQMYQNKKLIKL